MLRSGMVATWETSPLKGEVKGWSVCTGLVCITEGPQNLKLVCIAEIDTE
jgi:hypothetical protein